MKLWPFLFASLAFGQTITLVGPTSVAFGAPATVQVGIVGAAGISAVQFSLNLTGVSVAAGPAATAAGKQVSCAQVGSQYNCIIWGPNATLIADGVLASVTFSPTASGQGQVTSQLGARASSDPQVIAAGPAYAYTVLSKCDINGDGKTDLSDAGLLVTQVQQQMAALQVTVANLQNVVNAANGGTCR
jgi:hypothetical protein